MKRHTRWLGLATLAIAVVAAACGGGDTATEKPSTGAITSTAEVKRATIQIVAKGNFAQPAGTLAAYE